MAFFTDSSSYAWNDETLSIGTTYSDWIPLIENCSSHSANGKFTSAGGAGMLKLSYQLASMPNSDYAVTQGVVFPAQTEAGSPFLKNMQLKGTYYLRFVAEVTVEDITGATVVFAQTGKGA